MTKYFIALALTSAFSGCANCKPKPFTPIPLLGTEVPWEVSTLQYMNPATMHIDLEEHAHIVSKKYWDYNQYEGIVYPGLYAKLELENPSNFTGGGDSALFTGFALAAFCYKGSKVGNYYEARRTLKGIYWLTHAAGPGVICRAVIPLHLADKWHYPLSWQSRLDSGFAKTGSPIQTPWGEFPESAYYTRATRDQLTGLLYGLAVAWKHLQEESDKRVITTIVVDLYRHLSKHNWNIRDERGLNRTHADKVSGLLRLQFTALYRAIAKERMPREYYRANAYYLEKFGFETAANLANIFNNYSQYYAHNLRVARALTIWLLEDDSERKKAAADFVVNHVWKHTKNHKNAWFASAVYCMTGDLEALNIYDYSIKSQALKPLRGYGSPYAGQERDPSLLQVLNGCADNFVVDPHLRKMSNYFIWTKRPWDVGDRDLNGYLKEPGLDFLLPYWLVESCFNSK